MGVPPHERWEVTHRQSYRREFTLPKAYAVAARYEEAVKEDPTLAYGPGR